MTDREPIEGKYVNADPAKMSARDLYELACKIAKFQVFGPWEKDDYGIVRKSQLGHVVCSVRQREPPAFDWFIHSAGQYEDGLPSREHAQTAVDAILLASGAVVVDPVVIEEATP